MARTITVKTLATPTGFAATPSTGGTLPAGTYYYKMIAVFGNTSTLSSSMQYRSAPCAEISVTVVANGKVDLSWGVVIGATGYIVWRSKVSGDYRQKVGFYKYHTIRSVYTDYS